jgi:hypothetical protein
VNAEPECITCNIKRIIIGVTPVARGYEMRSLECPPMSQPLEARRSAPTPALQNAIASQRPLRPELDRAVVVRILIGWSKLESHFAIAS